MKINVLISLLISISLSISSDLALQKSQNAVAMPDSYSGNVAVDVLKRGGKVGGGGFMTIFLAATFPSPITMVLIFLHLRK